MKKIFFIFIALAFLTLKSKGQCLTFTIQTTSITCSGCCDGSISIEGLTGGCGPYSYDWTPGVPIGDGTDSISGLCPGVWIVTIQDAGCCPDSSVTCCLDCTTGIIASSFSAIKSFVTQDNFLMIENLKGAEIIELYDLAGRKILNIESSNVSEIINLGSLNKQMYILLITDKEKNIVFRKKIVW